MSERTQSPVMDARQSVIKNADALFKKQAEWPLERFDEAAALPDWLPNALAASAERHNTTHTPAQLQHTTRFLDRVLTNSPLPPIQIERFIDQIVASQATKGVTPVVFQAIACLNYSVEERSVVYGTLTELRILSISNTRDPRRWGKLMAPGKEMQQFLIGLTEIGARPLIAFGVSDVLDFEHEDIFSHSSEELALAVAQNRDAMHEGVVRLDKTLASLPIASPSLRPSIKAFNHSDLLRGTHGEVFHENLKRIEANEPEIFAFRDWLFRSFPKAYGRSRKDPMHGHRLSQMMALYATDNMRAVDIAKSLFPDEPINASTSLSLQPHQVWEWIEEKVGCEMTETDIVQLTPFPNAGSWHSSPEHSIPFDLRSENGLEGLSPTRAFRQLMKIEDAELVPESSRQAIPDKDLIQRKELAARDVLKATYGEAFAEDGLNAYKSRRQKPAA